MLFKKCVKIKLHADYKILPINSSGSCHNFLYDLDLIASMMMPFLIPLHACTYQGCLLLIFLTPLLVLIFFLLDILKMFGKLNNDFNLLNNLN